MATVEAKQAKPPWIPRQKPWPKRDGIFRFTVEQAYQLAEFGFFDDRHVELLEGVLYEMTTLPPHLIAAERVMRWSVLRFGDLCIRLGAPFDVGRKSLPEPDLAIVPGEAGDYAEGHPKTALLVLEISDSTLRKDRTLKAHLYASAGLADYWILNLQDRQLEIHRSPGRDPSRKGRFRYSEITIVPADGYAVPLARPEARVAVADLLP
jgi:Putative restriction endonuclease